MLNKPMGWALTAILIAFVSAHSPVRSATSTIGNGQVKVALIVPLSGSGGAIGRSLKNAAEMALEEWGDTDIQLLVEDDGGSTAGAERAAQQALDDGAEIILGPLVAGQVRAAGSIARPRGVPVIALTNNMDVAAPGVYVLGYLPKFEVDRIVGYAIANGRHTFAALLPETPWGRAVEKDFRDAVQRVGGTLAAVEHYPPGASPDEEAVRRLAGSAADAILITDAADTVIRVAHSLDPDLRGRTRLIGTSDWSHPHVFADPVLKDGWFATPDTSGVPAFRGRYRYRFGEDASAYALLAYDAVALVIVLNKTYGPGSFSDDVLTDPSGFRGILGAFRFHDDGTNERALGVCRVAPSGGEVLSPVPSQF
jgi:ABC-type branched-subunit amino acid transport system substrate-binding protein